MFRIDT